MDCIDLYVCVYNGKTKNLQKRKDHVTFVTAEATKLVFGMFLLIALDTNITIPKYQKKSNATYTKKVMNRFHEVKKLYNVTLKEMNNFQYSTEISSNEWFTFQNAMKQEDKLSFFDEMYKDITDHKEGIHC